MIQKIVACALMLVASCGIVLGQGKDKYLQVSITNRVKEMLARMTVDEKIAQLRSTWSAHPKITDAILNDPHMMDSLFSEGIGMINPDFDNSLEESIRYRNAIQTYLQTHTRLGIPAIFLDEAHHGLLAQQADVFPTSIALACSWDTALVERIYSYVAAQASARGTSMVLAPVVDVTRDPRWGRTSETYGEDPYLNGLMGSAVVRGFQGSSDGTIPGGHVAATLKHFTGHGEPEGGQNQGPADYPERVLRTFHMEPFRIAIDHAHPWGVMAAYVEIDGVPCHSNKWLLKDVLRGEWGYNGVVVSDWWGIDQLFQKHLVAADRGEAAFEAFEAGVTVDLPMGANYADLKTLFLEHKISMSTLDKAVSYVLTLKGELGLLKPTAAIDLTAAKAQINCPERRALALEAARESMVLLKNDGILPFQRSRYKKIAVIGPCAATNYTGDYSGVPVHNVSLLEGIRNKVGTEVEVVYAKGVDLSLNGDTVSMTNFQYIDSLVPANADVNRRKIDSAVGVARGADLIICALGENEQFVREAEAPHHYGDISTLKLRSQQDDLLRALVATGKPLVVYLAHGRPLAVNYAAEHADAILDGWFTGEEAGNAAADILFGDVNPSGKLTISVPRSVGQLPIYYNHKPSAQFLPYVTESNSPLYTFGYGLSYTHFRYGAPTLSAYTMLPGGHTRLTIRVTNDGNRSGDEIVQLYVHPKVARFTQPVLALKAFSRVHLDAGETKEVSFEINRETLSYYTIGNQKEAVPGGYEILIGGSSVNLKKVILTIRE